MIDLDNTPLPPGFRRAHEPRPRGLTVALDRPLRPKPTWRERPATAAPACHAGSYTNDFAYDPHADLD